MDLIGMLMGWTGAFLVTRRNVKLRFYGFIFYMLANASWIAWAALEVPPVWTIVGQCIVFTGIAALGVWNHRPGLGDD